MFSSVYVASLTDGPAYLAEVSDAFLSGLSVVCLTVTVVTLAGCAFALRFLPARAEA